MLNTNLGAWDTAVSEQNKQLHLPWWDGIKADHKQNKSTTYTVHWVLIQATVRRRVVREAGDPVEWAVGWILIGWPGSDSWRIIFESGKGRDEEHFRTFQNCSRTFQDSRQGYTQCVWGTARRPITFFRFNSQSFFKPRMEENDKNLEADRWGPGWSWGVLGSSRWVNAVHLTLTEEHIDDALCTNEHS